MSSSFGGNPASKSGEDVIVLFKVKLTDGFL